MAPKTTNLNGVGGGTSIDHVDWRDASHALTGLSQPAYAWALYRFAGQEEKFKQITKNLTMILTLYIKVNRYKVKPETLDGLVRAAMLEFTMPVCGTCHGTGWVSGTKAQNECSDCMGRGRKSISTRERCNVIGISHKSYTNTHDLITKEIMRLISDWEQEIIKNVNKKLGEAA